MTLLITSQPMSWNNKYLTREKYPAFPLSFPWFLTREKIPTQERVYVYYNLCDLSNIIQAYKWRPFHVICVLFVVCTTELEPFMTVISLLLHKCVRNCKQSNYSRLWVNRFRNIKRGDLQWEVKVELYSICKSNWNHECSCWADRRATIVSKYGWPISREHIPI